MRRSFPLLALLLLLLAAAAIWRTCRGPMAPDQRLHLSGNIEVIETALSFKAPGIVMERLVDEGQSVTAGSVVARLEHADLAEEISLRAAEVRVAEAALAELQAGSRPEEIAQAEAARAYAQADCRRTEDDYARQKELYAKNAIATRDIQAAETAVTMAQARVRESDARLTLLKKGPRTETISAAQARRDATRQALALAETRLSYTILTAPISGTVLAKNVEVGEYVAPGTPIVMLGNLSNVWLRGYIEETALGRLRIGQRAQVTTDTYPGRAYAGRLSFIAEQAEFTPKNIQTEKERVRLVYRVKVDLPNPGQELKPGMPADAVLLEDAARP